MPRKKKPRGNLLLKILLSLVAGVFVVWMAPDLLSAQEKGSPKMVLKEQLVDFKDVIEGKDITHSFEVHNQGDENLKIEQVKPDCSCSIVQFDRLIPPNKQGKITVKVDTKGFDGNQRWGIRVLTNDPKWPEAVLDLRANIKPIITLSGKAVLFTGRNDVAVTKAVEIGAGVERLLTITPGQFTLPGKVIWSIEEIEKEKTFRITLKSIPGTSENYRGFLTLKTNFPEKPELTIWNWRGLSLVSLRLFVGLVFVYASFDKILRTSDFAEIIYNYQVLPEILINLVSVILPWLELLLGLLLIFGVWLPGAVLLCNLLFLFFFATLIFNTARGMDIDCGCFSISSATSSGGQMLWYLLRDGLFLLLGLCLFFFTFFRRKGRGSHSVLR